MAEAEPIFQCKNWVFTYHGTEESPPCSHEIVMAKLKALKPTFFRFQLERCATTKRLHYQGTVGFPDRKRNSTLQTRLWKGFWEKCHKPEDSVAYCGKNETHVDGPWDFGQLPGSRKYRTGFKAELEEQWQTELFKLLDETAEDDIPMRQILWYWSDSGARGKSSTVHECEDNHKAIVTEYNALEPHRNLYAIASEADPAAVGLKTEPKYGYNAIIIDVPRGSRYVQEAGLYTTLETLCGERFSNTFQRPGRVKLYPCFKIVFANWPPNCDPDIISQDRFKVVCVD